MNVRGSLFALLCSLTVLLCGCDKTEDPGDQDGPVEPRLYGVVEKGPYLAKGSNVEVAELDENMERRGRTYWTTVIDDRGTFDLSEMDLKSEYILVCVTGKYFNELTGEVSPVSTTLQCVCKRPEQGRIGVNVLTDLERNAIQRLIRDGKDFQSAKTQAQREVLAVFGITEEFALAEQLSLADGNKGSELLLALSSIVLAGESDENNSFIGSLNYNLSYDSAVDQEIRDRIARSSASILPLYGNIKEHVQNRYKELGREVKAGDYYKYIDLNGDGIVGNTDPDNIPEIPGEEVLPETDADFRLLSVGIWTAFRSFAWDQVLADALYSRSVERELIPSYANPWVLYYEHNVDPDNNNLLSIWSGGYRVINKANSVVKYADKEEFLKCAWTAKVARAIVYSHLVDLWGDGVALHAQLPPDAKPNQPGASALYDRLIADLEEVENLLPETEDGLSVCSKYVAKAVLARLYLQKGDYARALAKTGEVAASEKYRIESNYDDVFKRGSGEMMIGAPVATEELPNANIYGVMLLRGDLIPVLRYAEVVLIAAECHVRGSQPNLPEAVRLVNLLRKRNGRTLLEITAPAGEITAALIEEWRKDMGRDGLTLGMLRHFGVAETTLGIPAYRTLLPLPDRVVASEGLTQNPGYKKQETGDK